MDVDRAAELTRNNVWDQSVQAERERALATPTWPEHQYRFAYTDVEGQALQRGALSARIAKCQPLNADCARQRDQISSRRPWAIGKLSRTPVGTSASPMALPSSPASSAPLSTRSTKYATIVGSASW